VTLTLGTHLGPYKILSALGAGGMGEVYRAADTKLRRDVAIKVLPSALASDPDRLARFQREAEVLASLNHPHIAQIYGLEDADGVKALVMELVEGVTLADRIAQHRLPPNEALPIARQIAEALEAAHAQGIIHRDLKPANVKVRPDGTVKVLDFGLAKAMDPAVACSGGQGGLSDSPTLTTPAMTEAGMILGTAPYMNPEQARGKAVDKRTDIWAFGCLVFEMLAGQAAFGGDGVSETLARIIEREPDWQALPVSTPPPIRRLLRRCLQKDPARRLDSAAVARFDVEEAMAPVGQDDDRVTPRFVRWRRALPWALIAASAVALALVLLFWRPASRRRDDGAHTRARGVGRRSDARDHRSRRRGHPVAERTGAGLRWATTHRGRVSVCSSARPVGCHAAAGHRRRSRPVFLTRWSVDRVFCGRQAEEVAVSGGAPVTICDTPDGRGGWWAADGSLVYAPFFPGTDRGGLLRVSSNGGMPMPVTSLAEGEVAHGWPQVLPGGNALLFTSHTSRMNWDDATVVVQSLPSGERKIVQRGGYYGRYLASGHIVYLHDAKIFAVPFDLERLEVTGPPFLALDGVGSNPNGGSAQFAASEAGTFVYVNQPTGSAPMGGAPIQWMDRAGRKTPLRATSTNWGNPRFSPDGTRLAVEINDGKQLAVWVYEWEHDRASAGCAF
jgi:serine/threonine-protein kinase